MTVRGLAVAGFAGTGIQVKGVGATLAELEVTRNMMLADLTGTSQSGCNFEDTSDAGGIRFDESAEDGVVGVPFSEHAHGTAPTFVYGNPTGVGIATAAARTTLNGVWGAAEEFPVASPKRVS